MKPAAAVALQVSKALAVAHAPALPPAAVRRTTATAAPRRLGQRSPPLQGARRAKESCGKEPAAKETRK